MDLKYYFSPLYPSVVHFVPCFPSKICSNIKINDFFSELIDYKLFKKVSSEASVFYDQNITRNFNLCVISISVLCTYLNF